jgi:hypothetical protein
LFAAIIFPFLSLGDYNWNFKAEVNPTMVNGIITADAIIFGFVTLHTRRLGRTLFMEFLLTLPLLVLLAATVNNYFIDAISLGYPTVNTMIWATVTFFYNIFYYVLLSFLVRNLERSTPVL